MRCAQNLVRAAQTGFTDSPIWPDRQRSPDHVIGGYAATSALPDVWAVAAPTRTTLECRDARRCGGNRSGRDAAWSGLRRPDFIIPGSGPIATGPQTTLSLIMPQPVHYRTCGRWQRRPGRLWSAATLAGAVETGPDGMRCDQNLVRAASTRFYNSRFWPDRHRSPDHVIADYAATSALPVLWAMAAPTRMTLECRDARRCGGNRSGRDAAWSGLRRPDFIIPGSGPIATGPQTTLSLIMPQPVHYRTCGRWQRRPG
jgi:hypothetical protein